MTTIELIKKKEKAEKFKRKYHPFKNFFKRRHVSQKSLAQTLNVSESAIDQYFSGRYKKSIIGPALKEIIMQIIEDEKRVEEIKEAKKLQSKRVRLEK